MIKMRLDENVSNREVSMRDVLDAKYNDGFESLNEASLMRAYQHVKKAGDVSFAIVTSWRYNLSKAANMSRLKNLETDIRTAGLGFFKMEGHWQECQDPDVDYKACPKDKLVDSIEPSLFVPKITMTYALSMAKKYDQDAVVYAGPETKGDVILLYKNGTKDNIGAFNPMKIAQAYSKVKGKSFTFEGFEYKPVGYIENSIAVAYEKNSI